MAIKRKATLDDFLGQTVSKTTTTTKRLSLGWGAWEKYYQHGRDLARNGKYANAIEVLSEALLQKNADSMKIMDSRSAVYCKMALYEKALSDAKHMIKAAAKDERGYLRAGKALLLDQKPEKALDVYAYALKNLGEDHPQREAVAKMHTKLTTKMSSLKQDPIFALNHDCLLEVFKHVPFRQVVSATRVSKAWHIFIKDHPSLWLNISFRGSRPPVSSEIVKACIRNSQNRVKTLQLHNVRDPLNAARQASQCPQLEHLDLNLPLTEHHVFYHFRHKHTLKTLILSEKIPLSDNMLWTLAELPNLERLEVYQVVWVGEPQVSDVGTVPNLKILTLNMKRTTQQLGSPGWYKPFWIPGSVPAMATIDDLHTRDTYFDVIPKLEELRLGAAFEREQPESRLQLCLDDICHPNLRLIHLSNITLYGTWACPDTVEHLCIIDCAKHPARSTNAPLRLTELKTLVLHRLDWLDHDNLALILEHNGGSLETLQIEQCDNFYANDILNVALANPMAVKNVKKLHLHGMRLYQLDNAALFPLLDLMPHLEELHIPNTSVTGTLIRRILENRMVPIELLNLRGCSEVSPEAVEYGRAGGLKIIRY
ncbi:Leucine Rich Repeat domain protein [Talaromyces stipitatus ATCC 10500]|uniref:Leucine Rich Repeat domain protein n=1 Tax=Talaromyces stipitatus (strain ATCC 10500 / CBS 375.48 / QM 6759 / NRRL 1006) TaxID=441959 RepID=B8MU21_TALSN|nr:Leucine Rich Repeat domain protein [Talaromyces stipitatus ATCC 10500]EED12654.1 Leucine Rich Repeat domain protein [Talaromyces stipitatus ATCC 10500]